jgi:hypothetical protein
MNRITVVTIPLWLSLVVCGETSAQVVDRDLVGGEARSVQSHHLMGGRAQMGTWHRSDGNELLTGPEIPGPNHTVMEVPIEQETRLLVGATVGAAALTAALWAYTHSRPGQTNRSAWPGVAGSFAGIAHGTMAVAGLAGYWESESWSTAANIVGLAVAVALVFRHARDSSSVSVDEVVFGLVPLVTSDGASVTLGFSRRLEGRQ